MPEELSVKVKICDRAYPMKVPTDREACVRQAGKMINSQVEAYKRKFDIHDPQDLLAMVAFDCLVDNLTHKEGMQTTENQLLASVERLVQLVTPAAGSGEGQGQGA
ncbi:MAG: cell division protein ZapA [Bacteroidota bacterium]